MTKEINKDGYHFKFLCTRIDLHGDDYEEYAIVIRKEGRQSYGRKGRISKEILVNEKALDSFIQSSFFIFKEMYLKALKELN